MTPKHLGKQSVIPTEPSIDILDVVPNPHPISNYVVRFICPEMNSICPATGSPDFATLIIDYNPAGMLVESKSLKLYLSSYRNHRSFHEDCTVQIGKDIYTVPQPRWLRISGLWRVRGGISINVFWQSDEAPRELYIPELPIAGLN